MVAGLSWGQAGSQIVISEAVIAQFEDGPQIGTGFLFGPGDPVFISLRFKGYGKSKDEEKPRIHLSWQVETLDPDGVPIVEPKRDKVDVELAPQDKNWMPKARHDFVLPSLADSGTYRVILTVKDEVNGTAAKKEMELRVKGHEVEKSEKLVARNFRWLRTEEDGQPLKSPAYRPGDQVWARFEMTGYKIGEKNAHTIAYGLEVFRADGKSMYNEPTAAQDTGESFYRKRYLPGVLNLNLQPDIAKGEYTIVLRLRDELGGQTDESKHSFQVE